VATAPARRRPPSPTSSGLEVFFPIGAEPVLERDGSDYEPMAQRVARQLRDAIFDGRLAPGAPVRQEAVAQQFGVSRVPVREALHQLEAEGLLDVRPHSGARVAVLDFEECLEIYKIRERLEPLAFSESVPNLTAEQRLEVAKITDEVEALSGDDAAWLDGDRRLHLAMYAGIATPRLLRMIVGIWNTTQRYRRLLLTTFDDEDYAIANMEHRLMVDAIQQGNIRAGEELVRVAMERTRLRLARNRDLFNR